MDEKWMNGKDFWKDDRRYSCIFGDSFFSGGCLQVSLLLPATVRDLGDMFSAWYCWDDFLLLRSWVWWLTNMFMRFKSLNWFCHVCGQSMWDSWDMLGYKMGQTWIPLVERNWPSERWGFFSPQGMWWERVNMWVLPTNMAQGCTRDDMSWRWKMPVPCLIFIGTTSDWQ